MPDCLYCKITFFVRSGQVQNFSVDIFRAATVAWKRQSRQVDLHVDVTDTLLADISECPETETVANTLWLVTNSKSCPNCK